MPSVLWRCWLSSRKGIWPVKNWVVGFWHGYLSGARCRFAYGPADVTATHYLFLVGFTFQEPAHPRSPGHGPGDCKMIVVVVVVVVDGTDRSPESPRRLRPGQQRHRRGIHRNINDSVRQLQTFQATTNHEPTNASMVISVSTITALQYPQQVYLQGAAKKTSPPTKISLFSE